MRVQIILNFDNNFRLCPLFNHCLLKSAIITFGSPGINFDQSFACQRFKSQKDRSYSVSLIFRVKLFFLCLLSLKSAGLFPRVAGKAVYLNK